jgi:antitoxin (DNA-binding transcriptional repressor) of toxin-antitoxin stability system
MRDIELNWEQSDADRDRLTVALMEAVSAALDRGEITMITVAGDPVAGIAPAGQITLLPADRLRGVQIGHGNTQSNTFGQP